MNLRPTFMLLAVGVAGAGAALAEPGLLPSKWNARERAVAQAITGEAIAARVRFLADDLLEGRGPGSRGSEVAMRYIAAEMERIGLLPGGDKGSFFQRFDIVGMKSETLSSPSFTASGMPEMALRSGEDCVVTSGVQTDGVRVRDAEVVFVGYGISAPEQPWDDFKGVDVTNKILLVMNNDPEDDPKLFAGRTRLYYGRWSYKYEEAARRGAMGAIIIHTTPSAGYPWQVVQTSWGGEDFELPTTGEPRTRVKMWVTEEAGRRIARMGGHDLDALRKRAQSRDFHPVALGVRMTVDLKTAVRRMTTANVIGRLPGSDGKLADQAVIYSAHHDHLGVGQAKNGDAIYNGALDNASGVGAMLAIADGMVRAQPAPKRSIWFAAVGVEESGLLGSEYFCKHPSVPVGRIAANINLDGINIWGRTSDISYIGFGKSSLDDVLKRAATEQGRVVKPDQFPDKGYFYRSDQFNFARVGVPAIYLDEGTDFIGHEPGWGRARKEEYEQKRYHQPSDQIDSSWVFDGAVDDQRLLAIVGLRIADAAGLPSWKPGDEFEAARKKALGQR